MAIVEMKVCKNHGLTDFVKRNDKRFRCRQCAVDAVRKRRHDVKKFAVEYKGGKCSRCGYNKSMSALAFHHTDPSQKDFNIGVSGYTKSYDDLKIELDKCELVCHNCHSEIHDELEGKTVH